MKESITLHGSIRKYTITVAYTNMENKMCLNKLMDQAMEVSTENMWTHFLWTINVTKNKLNNKLFLQRNRAEI
jgi:hypothetical protein